MSWLISYFGIDRFAHLGIGGLICAIISDDLIMRAGVTGWRSLLYTLVGITVVFAISVIKEYLMDSKVDWVDIAFAMIGCALYVGSRAIGIAMT